MRADSGFYAHEVVAVCAKLGVRFSITIRQQRSVRRLIEAIPESAWTPIPYWMQGGADVAETSYTPFASEKDAKPVRLIVRRVRPTPGSQLALFALYDYHAFITDRDGETLVLEADHRRHAEIENAIRDLKYGVGLNHLPSGKFAANAAWLAVQVIAHNLARWTARIGLRAGIVTTKTLRRRLFNLPGRLTRSARRVTLHLPARWPWAIDFAAPSPGSGRSRSSPDYPLTTRRRFGAGGSLRKKSAAANPQRLTRPDRPPCGPHSPRSGFGHEPKRSRSSARDRHRAATGRSSVDPGLGTRRDPR